MDYEKAYKEALERAKGELQACGSQDCDAARQIFRFFPELAESEDERISREITEFIVNFHNGNYEKPYDYTIGTWIAWLEKQGNKAEIEEIKGNYGGISPKWHDISEEPVEMKELLVEWDSEDATWHEVAFYHADTKTFWDGERQVGNVTRWCYIDDLVEKQGEEKPMKVYRVENEAEQKGLWRKFDGTWQPLFDMLTDGKCKDMPMEDNPIYREGGKRWFASAPSKETLQKWFSKRDLEELVSKGFTISEFEVVRYKKVSDFEYIFTRDNIINRNYLEVSDIYSEQKDFAPKVKPKFKVGDWCIDNEDGTIFQIAKVLDNTYTYKTTEGSEYSCTHYSLENDAKLYTIQDAKDGDVLAYVPDEKDLWIMIYRSLYEPYEGHVHYHALLVNDNFSDKGTCCICIDDLKPATKEQRDLLFQKMKEAGYEWDAKKKELREIERKDSTEEISGNLRGISPNSKWTEEDEKSWLGIIDEIEANKSTAPDYDIKTYDMFLSWLKSLKQRMEEQQ